MNLARVLVLAGLLPLASCFLSPKVTSTTTPRFTISRPSTTLHGSLLEAAGINLDDPALRRRITGMINMMIDIPFLTESMEGQIIASCVDLCLDSLLSVTTATAQEAAASQSRSLDFGDEESVKLSMVDSINSSVNLPGLDEEQEKVLIQCVVDSLMKLKGDGELEKAAA